MKKSILLVCCGLLLAVNSCRKQSLTDLTMPVATDPTQLDEFIRNQLLTKGEFLWAWATEEMVWTALSNSDFVLSVGYQPTGAQNVADRLHLIDIHTAEWQQARHAVLQTILDSERALDAALTEEKLLAFTEDGVLPVFDVRVKNPATIALLRGLNLVRYAEPIGYEPYMTHAADRSDSGCGSNTAQVGLVAGVDYLNITPGCKQSWNHSYHSLTQAWTKSTGAGVTVTVIDSGCSFGQNNLDGEFNQGQSSGRSITRLVTLPQETNFWGQPTGSPETPDDGCGHGTSMLGACGGPRGVDGASTGTAYNCNLISIRAATDVYLDESRETVGVSNAFVLAANNGNVRIISMSMGRLTSASQISDAIKLAYNNGKLIFCAAGTSFWWTAWFAGVIFPATMTEAVAVTGMQDNLNTRCSSCHSGSKVDFVLVMEKASNEQHPLSLAMDGDIPSTVGGSSVATASTAGIAALVWAKYPSWTRTQVMTRLKTSANYYPSRNSNFGWGRINANTATN